MTYLQPCCRGWHLGCGHDLDDSGPVLTSQVGEDVGVSGSDVLGVLSLEGAAWTALSIQKNSIRNEIMMIRLLNIKYEDWYQRSKEYFFLDLWKTWIWMWTSIQWVSSLFLPCFWYTYHVFALHYCTYIVPSVLLCTFIFTKVVCGFTTYYV